LQLVDTAQKLSIPVSRKLRNMYSSCKKKKKKICTSITYLSSYKVAHLFPLY
jgi:hypothetical protein